MESSLVVIGLNFHTAPVDVRERFWIGEHRRYQALQRLQQMDGIEEVVILATCNRTEFVVWASDFSVAAGSVLAFLTREHGMKIEEWTHFYRLVGDDALLHLFRVAASLDSMIVGSSDIADHLKASWVMAGEAGTCGRFLDHIIEKALAVAHRVYTETEIGKAALSIPFAAVQLAKEILGPLAGRNAVVMGDGHMGQLSVRLLLEQGAKAVQVTKRVGEDAADTALAATSDSVRFEDRWKYLEDADVVVTSTGCPHIVLSRGEAARLCDGRGDRPIFFIDISLPRNIEASVREVRGAFLYDLDDLEKVVARNMRERRGAAADAERLVAEEERKYRRQLASDRMEPSIVALRKHLDEIARHELARYAAETARITPAECETLSTVISRVVQRIAGSLARELKEAPETADQRQLAGLVQRLFQPERTAGTAVVKGVGNA